VTFVHLDGPKALLAERLSGRKGHFFPASLLDSQLATLQPPASDERAIIVSIDQTPEAIVEEVALRLHLPAGAPPA
jgi:carbohydrate kinase (thermoresistant glucokinase family)